MSSGTFPAKARRRLQLVALFLCSLSVLPGCDPDPYPADLRYPIRTDLLVEKATGETWETYRPGRFDQHFLDLKKKADNKEEGFEVLDPSVVTPAQRRYLGTGLKDYFGTPGAPLVSLSESEKGLIDELKLGGDTLGKGSILYRRHCLHCHGVAGDGRGPTGPWINPPPRDFRRGMYKFTSIVNPHTPLSKPLRTDLVRTVREGIEGTAMPNFRYLSDEDLDALVSYVIHLSIRGTTEYDSVKEYIKGNLAKREYTDLPSELPTKAANYTREWKDGAVKLDPILEYPAEADFSDPSKKAAWNASVSSGHKLFLGEAGCVKCHTDYGRQAKFRYDVWGTLVRPNNLTQGIYRGGRRPIDLYYRINQGIAPVAMPALPDSIGKDRKKMWDLVNFVRAIPYPNMLPDDVRGQIYGPAKQN